MRREWLRWLRDWRSTAAAMVVGGCLAALVAWVCRVVPDHGVYAFKTNSNVPAFCFLCVVLVKFLALSSAVQEIVRDRAVRHRERLLRVPGWMWLAGKLPFLLIQSAAHAALVVAAAAFIIALPYAFFELWIGLLMTGCCSAAAGLAVSSLPRMTEKTALAAVPLLLVPQMILCGADPFGFDKVAHLHWPAPTPKVSQQHHPPWPAQLMPSRWGYQAVIAALRDHPFLASFEANRLRQVRVGELFARDNQALWRNDSAAFQRRFREHLAEKTGASYTVPELMADLMALVRAGYRSAPEVREKLGLLATDLAIPDDDRRDWINEPLLASAWFSFPVGGTLLGRSCSLICQSRWLLSFYTLAFLAVAATLLSAESLLIEAQSLLKNRWRQIRRMMQSF